MSRKGQCFWTRKLELDLVELVRRKECIWKPSGNTNHHIQQKYKAYAEIAAALGRGFTARSIRDRWVNIRSTFNHNLRRVERSRQTATNSNELYIPCWPLWKPLQFLRSPATNNFLYDHSDLLLPVGFKALSSIAVKEELQSDIDETIAIRQSSKRTDRPRKKFQRPLKHKSNTKCKNVLDDLVQAMKPLTKMTPTEHEDQSYWHFGKHVTERLNSMKEIDAECARNEIVRVLQEIENKEVTDFEDMPSQET
ncbi:alcohol dehydrogenase transcription factor myb/SANT-like domain-containing protein [Phthorimaea operculella]|nr:alcohol dehydrogenase transcription factor myb/SANT-like domain-containing protein [Phthorimaea operculella]